MPVNGVRVMYLSSATRKADIALSQSRSRNANPDLLSDFISRSNYQLIRVVAKMPPPRILLFSLGNPSPYLNTLHSAGHHALTSLIPLLPSQPPFAKTRHASKSALTSISTEYVLIQSPSLMNISGKYASAAYRAFEDPTLSLLIVHDDLEEDLGVVRIRKWSSSHRGHNGVKSVGKMLRPADFPEARFARISIGIGRPEAREREEVSDYVLRQMTGIERKVLAEKAGEGLLRCLREWEAKIGERNP
ncbi:hypothetical protein ACHAQH_005272 [Verticillium albo-atrum]